MSDEICDDALCRGTGKCLREEHVEFRAAMRLEPDAIASWTKRQSESGGDFGGTCEFEHDEALALVKKLSAEVARLQATQTASYAAALDREIDRLNAIVARFDSEFGGMHVQILDPVNSTLLKTTLRERVGIDDLCPLAPEDHPADAMCQRRHRR